MFDVQYLQPNPVDANEMSHQESRVPELLSIVTAFFTLALSAVTLRLVSRRISSVKLWWDDWILLVATVRSSALLKLSIS